MDKDLNIGDCQLMFGDCLERMKEIPNGSIDMILCDLPYGVLNKNNPDAKWDCILPFDKLWNEYDRVIKDNGAIVLFGQGMTGSIGEMSYVAIPWTGDYAYGGSVLIQSGNVSALSIVTGKQIGRASCRERVLRLV